MKKYGEIDKYCMGASSQTGVGIGDSHGIQKGNNHVTCSCGKKCDPIPPKPPVNVGCYTRISTGSRASISTGSRSSIRVCR